MWPQHFNFLKSTSSPSPDWFIQQICRHWEEPVHLEEFILIALINGGLDLPLQTQKLNQEWRQSHNKDKSKN